MSSASVSPLVIGNPGENHLSSSSSYSTSSSSSSSSSPDRQTQGYLLLNDKSRRKKRSFMPDNKKDPIYWSQRSKNNISAQRSRVKRRVNDLVLETKLTELSNENQILRAKIDMLARKFNHLSNEEMVERHPTAEKEKLLLIDSSSPPSDKTRHEEQTLLDKAAPVSTKWRLKLFNTTPNP